jgi:glycosyltransferase involved in cell wall biosynthesis
MTADEGEPAEVAVAEPSPPDLPVPAAAAARSGDPIAVSVVIPTYNSVDLLAVALDALAAQTLPADRFEVIVVDDGSTDGTWDYLTERAQEWPNLRVVQQPPSGRPSVGRNRGLTLAQGTYVFFHDADDYLDPDALRRLVDFADQHGSDVVVGRVTPVGRPHTPAPPRDNIVDADLIKNRIWNSLAPQKLFRRALIDRLAATFPEDQVQGEDQVFVATCLFAAGRISKLRDADYYFRRTRDDGQNVSSQPQTLTNKLLTTTRMAGLIVENTAPGDRRDALFRRVLLDTLSPALNKPFQRADREERERFLAGVQREVLPHLTDEHLAGLKTAQQLRMLTARDGTVDQLVDLNQRIEAGWRYRVERGEVDGVDEAFLCYDVGADLNALLPPAVRRVERLPTLQHRVTGLRGGRGSVHVDLDLKRDQNVVDLEHAALVAVPRPRGAEVLLDRRPARDRIDLTVTLTDLSAAAVAGPGPAPKAWDLVLRSYQSDALVAITDLGWPEELGPEATVESRPHLLRASTVAVLKPNDHGGVAVRIRQVVPAPAAWSRRMRRRARRVQGLLRRLLPH